MNYRKKFRFALTFAAIEIGDFGTRKKFAFNEWEIAVYFYFLLSIRIFHIKKLKRAITLFLIKMIIKVVS